MAVGFQGPPAYEYTKLANLHNEQGVRHIWASVAECSVPRPTRGTDMVCNMYIVDPSIAVEDRPGQMLTAEQERMKDGIEVLIFASEPSLFPKLRNRGDLIRFHRVEVTEFRGKPQLLAKIGRGRECHFCTFDGQISAPEEPYQKSSVSYSMTASDKELLAYLRQFYSRHAAPNGNPGDKYLKRIMDLRINSFVDIVCKVVAVEQHGPRDPTIFVWDGSDAYPYPPQTDFRQQEGEGAVQQDGAICRRVSPIKGEGVIQDFPKIGTALPVSLHRPVSRRDISKRLKVFPSTDEVPLPELPGVGAWVKLRNVCVIAVGGQLQALYQPQSKWSPWQESLQSAYEQQQRQAANMVAGWAPSNDKDLLALWTSPERLETPYSTLRQVLMDAGMDVDSGVEHMYRCLVRVMDHKPTDPTTFCRRRTPRSPMEFCMKLLLQDATAELDVMLLGEHGSAFFQGCPQQDLKEKPDYAAALQGFVDRLEAADMIRDDGVWLECCILRTYPNVADRTQLHAQYRIIDTVIQ